MKKGRSISTGRARMLAVKASVDPRTLVKLLRGDPVVGLAGDRARKVLVEEGLLKEEQDAA